MPHGTYACTRRDARHPGLFRATGLRAPWAQPRPSRPQCCVRWRASLKIVVNEAHLSLAWDVQLERLEQVREGCEPVGERDGGGTRARGGVAGCGGCAATRVGQIVEDVVEGEHEARKGGEQREDATHALSGKDAGERVPWLIYAAAGTR